MVTIKCINVLKNTCKKKRFDIKYKKEKICLDERREE